MNLKRKLLRERYHAEVQRKESFESKLNFPIAIISLLLGTLIFIAQNLNCIQNGAIGIIFYSLALLLLLSFVVGLFFLIKILIAYSWLELPYQEQLEEDWKNYEEYYRNDYFSSLELEEKEKLLNEDFLEILDSHYRESVKAYIKTNDKRSTDLYRTNVSLIASGILLFLLCFPFFYSFNLDKKMTEEENQIFKIEYIKELKEFNNIMKKEKGGDIVSNKENQTPPPKPQTTSTSRLVKNEGEAVKK